MPATEFDPASQPVTPAVVRASRRLTPADTAEVRQIVLFVDAPAGAFPSAHTVGVLVPGPHPFGNRAHHRYYTIADARACADGVELELLVRRCFYVDEVSGEEYPGIASNFLCDAAVGDPVTLTGPYPGAFRVPENPYDNLLMLGTGTGIAPFRAFLRRIYEQHGEWHGKVRLYYGARHGTELLYMNDLNDDLANYYDQATFRAIRALRASAFDDEADALRDSLRDHAAEVWDLICTPTTHVYLAGMRKIADAFEASMRELAGGEANWRAIRRELVEQGRWSELTYI